MKKFFKVALALLYIFCLCYIVFFARRRQGMQHAPRSFLVNVVPVVRQVRLYKILNPKDPREERNFFYNLFGNVLLFLPFPILLFFFGYRNDKKVLLAAFVLSMSIEIIQFYFTIGVADVDDVILNTAGALIGILLVKQLPVPVRSAIRQ